MVVVVVAAQVSIGAAGAVLVVFCLQYHNAGRLVWVRVAAPRTRVSNRRKATSCVESQMSGAAAIYVGHFIMAYNTTCIGLDGGEAGAAYLELFCGHHARLMMLFEHPRRWIERGRAGANECER